jgi:hypothetical protein
MPMTCDTLFRCRETPHSDVLNQNTAPATKRKVQVRGRFCEQQRRPFGCLIVDMVNGWSSD